MEDRVSGPSGLRVSLGCSGHLVTGSRGSGLLVFMVQRVLAGNPLEPQIIAPNFTTERSGHTGSRVWLTGHRSKHLGSAENRILSTTRVDPPVELAETRVTRSHSQLSRSGSISLNSPHLTPNLSALSVSSLCS